MGCTLNKEKKNKITKSNSFEYMSMNKPDVVFDAVYGKIKEGRKYTKGKWNVYDEYPNIYTRIPKIRLDSKFQCCDIIIPPMSEDTIKIGRNSVHKRCVRRDGEFFVLGSVSTSNVNSFSIDEFSNVIDELTGKLNGIGVSLSSINQQEQSSQDCVQQKHQQHQHRNHHESANKQNRRCKKCNGKIKRRLIKSTVFYF